MPNQTLTAVLYREENWLVAECPEVGTVSQGKTIEEAISNLREATQLYLEEAETPLRGRAMITTFEAAVNA